MVFNLYYTYIGTYVLEGASILENMVPTGTWQRCCELPTNHTGVPWALTFNGLDVVESTVTLKFTVKNC